MRKRRDWDLRTAPIILQGTYVYRSDGAARGQGRDTDIQSAYGAALFDGNSIIAHISHPIPSCTNNIAEYSGVLACFQDAIARNLLHIEFQVDSMLVSKQTALLWRCLSNELRPHYEEAIRLTSILREKGVSFTIRHIYRELNATADSLANRAIDSSMAERLTWMGWGLGIPCVFFYSEISLRS